MKKRADFLRVAATDIRFVTAAFVLQRAGTADDKQKTARIGFTATKKLGGAVQRNRAKRRLRALADAVLAPHATAGDYVLVARDGIFEKPYNTLKSDLEKALQVLKCYLPVTPAQTGDTLRVQTQLKR